MAATGVFHLATNVDVIFRTRSRSFYSRQRERFNELKYNNIIASSGDNE